MSHTFVIRLNTYNIERSRPDIEDIGDTHNAKKKKSSNRESESDEYGDSDQDSDQVDIDAVTTQKTVDPTRRKVEVVIVRRTIKKTVAILGTQSDVDVPRYFTRSHDGMYNG